MRLVLASLALALPASALAADPQPPEPRVPLASLVTTEDYPVAALRANEEGVVAFRADVDVAGKVAGCSILASSGSKALDEATCALVTQRFTFHPARDARGRAVAGTHRSRIVWRIPGDEAEPDLSIYPGVEAGIIVLSGCTMSAAIARAPSTPAPDDADAVLRACADAVARLARIWPKDTVLGDMDWLIDAHKASATKVLSVLRAAPKQP